MGKSMRSKAHRHKRTKRRERAQGHYDKLLEERAEVARKHLEEVRGCGASGGREPEGGARRRGEGRGATFRSPAFSRARSERGPPSRALERAR